MDILNRDPRDADDWDPLRGVYGYLDDDVERNPRNVYDGQNNTDEEETDAEKQAAADAALKWLL